ncbi:MAG TPA: competence protein CoiA family protein [Ktedonobacteraceae bacterium]|nr:competence protein CoiA family protein [Ktedonobacteraceae bacterium]
MLVAYGPEGQSVVAEETPLEQLQQWSRERMLYCPNCRGSVHVRGGPEKRTQLHFAHQKGECAWSTEAESVRHARGKVVIANWLREQFPEGRVTLEERLPEPNRIADIYLVHADGRRWALEFQCAPLDVEEWKHRHSAYREAHILDIWIIGTNRREKQEAFIEAILAMAHEVLFLDPQVAPPQVWLRWPVTREVARQWERDTAQAPSLEGWVGRLGYGATVRGRLPEVRLGEHGQLLHPVRLTLERRTRLLNQMTTAVSADEALLVSYLRSRIDGYAVQQVIIPLLHAYMRDPDLLRRYNYGRGQANHAPTEDEQARVQRARQWLASLAQQGFTRERLHELAHDIPFVGPYASFARYIEMLIAL